MTHKTIHINEDLCVGCGLCANTCHQGAIALIQNKAKLIKEDHCDGLGRCLPVCPVNAISFIDKPAKAPSPTAINSCAPTTSSQWPLQLQLVSVNAHFFNGADLLVAADCSAFTYANFHQDFMKNHATLIACPKLDHADYASKLQQIISQNNIKSIRIVRMEVPCCGGLERMVKLAIANSQKTIPLQITTLSTTGKIID